MANVPTTPLWCHIPFRHWGTAPGVGVVSGLDQPVTVNSPTWDGWLAERTIMRLDANAVAHL